MININEIIKKQRTLSFVNTPAITIESVKQLLKEYTQLLLQEAADKATIQVYKDYYARGSYKLEHLINKESITSIINDINFD